ncbi:MAG: carboxypeptidase-like regulatory domain-containing protein [Saprospiraceae bacterium]|nr:carboxypeptidase-like regulatory domain-containing protein [Saprospiraceae bacterium]
MRLQISFLLFFLSGISLPAQITVQGTVLDADTREVLPFANVFCPETNTGAITDLDGYFKLSLKPGNLLQVSFIGYETQEIECRVDTLLLIYLEPDMKIIGCPVIYDSPIEVGLPAPFMKLKWVQLTRDQNLSLLPALNRVPGIHMQSGNLNTNRISIRGIGSRSLYTTSKIRIYLDDVPLTSGNGESSIEDIDLSLIDHVQIWKGPAASVYGSGLGGMIQLHTEDRKGPGANMVYSQGSLGTFGLFRNSSGFRANVGEQGGYLRANYHITSMDGFRQNSGFRREGLNFIGKFPIGLRSEISFLSLYSKVKAYIPSSLNETDFRENPAKAADSWQAIRGFEAYEQFGSALSFKSNLLDLGANKLMAQFSLFSSFRNGYESRPFNILDDARQAIGFRTSLSLDEGLISSAIFPRGTIGIEYFQDKYQWQTLETLGGNPGLLLSNNRETRSYYNIFAQYYKEFYSGWTLLGGTNISQTSYQIKDLFFADSLDISGDYSYKPALSMRLGTAYRFNSNFSVFANVSNGQSPPSLEETLLPDGQINAAIRPEQGWNFEVGSRGRLFRTFFYEVSVYRMLVKDLLVAQRVSADQYIGLNAGKTRHDGLEAYLDWEISLGKIILKPYLSYTLTNYRFIDFIDGEADYSGNALTGVAPHQVFAGMDCYLWAGFYGSLHYEYRSAFPIRDDNSVYSDAYQLAHLKVGYKKSFEKGWTINLHAGIQNLGDAHYASMILINAPAFGGAPRYYYPGMPRQFYGGVEVGKVF